MSRVAQSDRAPAAANPRTGDAGSTPVARLSSVEAMTYGYDDSPPPPPAFVMNAYSVVRLWEAYEAQCEEIERLRAIEKKYGELLTECIHRGQTDVGNMLSLILAGCLKPREVQP